MIGRKEELVILKKTLQGSQSEFISILGRRRVGKTFLIEEFYEEHMRFQMSGQKDFSNKDHLKIFKQKLNKQFDGIKLPNKTDNWLNGIQNLIYCLENTKDVSTKKRVVFFDEVPWLSKPKSKFLAALGYFWNEYARKNKIILVICGSASSWMLSKIIKEKGSLYNRMTKLIHIQPFSIAETQAFLESKGIFYNTEQLISIYMAFGGIPHYLNEVESGTSAVQNIQRMCFTPNGLLVNEYGNLYDALFTNSQDHKKIIEALFKTKRGLTKLQIAKETELSANGAFYIKIEELISCGFVMEVQDVGKKTKHNLLRLIDEYSLFYHQFIKGNKTITEDHWHGLSNTPQYHSWSGYAFENFCFRHLKNIKKALGINGIISNTASFYAKPSEKEPGAQIDMVIDRADKCINIIECKYFKEDFYLSKSEAEKIKSRKAVFRYHSNTKKQLFVTLISPGRLIQSKESIGLIDNTISADELLGININKIELD